MRALLESGLVLLALTWPVAVRAQRPGTRRRPAGVALTGDSVPRYVRLRVIATNDFHGALDPISVPGGAMRGGADAMAATIARAARGCSPPNCATLLVDAGDLFQGSAASNLAHGAPVVALYNALGYAATAIGNHEFDWGIDTLRVRMREARFGILAANVRDLRGRLPSWARDDTILDRGALRVGIIGVIGPETYHSIMASRVRGLRFDDPAPIIDSLARSLRARGVDVVIVLAHSGAFCDGGGERGCHGPAIDLARRLTEPVNAIISGHTHTLVDARVDRVPIVQARASGRAVAVLDLAIAPTAARDSVLSQTVLEAATDGDPPPIDSIVRAADARVAGLERRRVARFARALERAGAQYPLGNLIADAQRWAGKADVAAVNNGGIRQHVAAGDATWGALFAVQPFANALRRLTVPGRALRAYLATIVGTDGVPTAHVSGIALAFDRSRADRAPRLVSARLTGGGELRDDARYTIVLNDFMATGAEGRILTEAATGDETLALDDLDALVAYLRSRTQPVAAPNDTRITISHP